MISEISWTGNDKYCMVSFICGILKRKSLKKSSTSVKSSSCWPPPSHLFTVSQPHGSLGPGLVLPQDLCTCCFLFLKCCSFRTLLQLPWVILNPSLSCSSVQRLLIPRSSDDLCSLDLGRDLLVEPLCLLPCFSPLLPRESTCPISLFLLIHWPLVEHLHWGIPQDVASNSEMVTKTEYLSPPAILPQRDSFEGAL